MKYSIILLLFFTSCGSVKKTNSETELKTESQKESTTDLAKFSNSYTLEPVDLSKPILIGKDTIYNTRVIYNNTKEIIKEKTNESNKSDLKNETQVKEVDYTETIKTISNRLIIALAVMFILFVILKRINI
jgi:hypothetical protein